MKNGVKKIQTAGYNGTRAVEISPKNATKYLVAQWHDHAKHSGLNSIFLVPKNESVLNILGYFLEQFQIFSQGLQPPEYL